MMIILNSHLFARSNAQFASCLSYKKLRNETDTLGLSAPGSRESQKYEDDANSYFVLTSLLIFVCPVRLFRRFLTLGRIFNFASRSTIHRKLSVNKDRSSSVVMASYIAVSL